MYKTTEMFPGKEDVSARVSTCVLAPGMNSFVLWVLREALQSGKQRLYFLARDGYFMYQIAKHYCESMQLPLECRYVSCSRYSVRIPVFQYDYEEALHYICRGGIDVNMRKILNRAGLSEAERQDVLENLKLTYQENDTIPYAELEQLKEKLRNCERLKKYIIKHSVEAMPMFKGYMRQEGFLENVPSAIVDSGWVGSMQKVMNQFLKQMGKTRQLEGYYWGLYELPQDVRREDYHCYYFTPESGLREKVHFSNCLFEGIFSAPHGMTLSYQMTGNGYEPVYDMIDDEKKRRIRKTEQYLYQYTSLLAENIKELSDIEAEKNRKVTKKLFGLFMGHPTKTEAEYYGRLKFSDDVLEYGGCQIAALLDEKELKANHVFNKMLVMLGIKKSYIKESAWYEGSAARHGKNVSYHLLHYRLYKYLLYIRKTILWRRNYGE